MKNKGITSINPSIHDKSSTDVSEISTELEPLKNMERRKSLAPKIVVCPPEEDTTEAIHVTRTERMLKAITSRLSRRRNCSVSDGSSSNSNVSDSSTGDDFSSESGSVDSERQSRRRSTISLRRVFKSFNLTPRSQSSSPTDKRKPKKQTEPKRILRSPVTYTYVRGLSGLPTQRVPRHTVFCATPGLNR